MSDFSELPMFLKEYIHENRWDSFRDVQVNTFTAFRENENHIIISSATSSGKTEAALFPVIASLYEHPAEGIGAMYIGPLKALIDDQFERMTPMLEKSDIKVTGWHGDISSGVKKRLLKDPEGILQITPESLQNIIVNHRDSLKGLFGGLRFVIIDEIHSFIPSPRGAQILCCLETIEKICGCSPRRIGLSATIGNKDSAKEWIAANTGKGVTVIDDIGSRDFDIHVVYNSFPVPSEEDPDCRKRALTSYYKDLFESVKGKDCLIFANSRLSAEKTARSLDIVASKYGSGNMVSVHHGSISKEFRKDAEERMKDRYRRTVTVATSSLELGIDVGSMERIIQVDPPMSCMSMLQRMGRSGRRGGRQDMTILCNDDAERPWTDVMGVSANLIKSIALIELAKEGWTEPLREEKIPYGLLFHQTLEYMASGTGCRFSDLWNDVLTMYPFRDISENEYKVLLRHMVSTGILERMDDGTLLIGKNGEHLVFGHDFCSVFDVRPEIDIFIDGRPLGSIQETPEVGECIQLAGRVWEVIAVSKDGTRADVRPSDSGSSSPWKSDVPDIDDIVMNRMYEILSSDTEYDYLDDRGRACLERSRAAFRKEGMDHLLTVTDWGIRICPWKGTKGFDTIRRKIVSSGVGRVYARLPYHIDVYTSRPGNVERMVNSFVNGRKTSNLILPDENICRGKFDMYLPRELLVRNFTANRLS